MLKGMSASPASPQKVWLLGELRIEGATGPLRLPPGNLQTLFAYLILHPNTPHPRAHLADLLWPEADPTRAGRNLSNLLYRLNQLLGPTCDADTETLTLRTGPMWVDVHAFEQHLATHTLQQAVDLYQGDLLPTLYDDWIIPLRERLRETYLTALLKLATLAESAVQPEAALAHYRQLLTADPLREDAARGHMRCLALLGRFSDALAAFAALEQALQTEIGVQPGLETRLLADRLRNEGEVAQRVAAHPVPAPFVGRMTERARLRALLDRARAGQGGLALVLGEPGIGKTRLLEELAHAAGWRGWQIAWGHGDEFHLPAPYSPLAHALTESLPPVRWNQLTRLVPDISLSILATLLPDLPHPTRPLTTVTPAQMHHALQNVLHGLQTISPHLLLLDDVQWADPRLWSVLDALRPALARMSLLLVLSARHSELQAQPTAWDLLQTWDSAGVPILHLSGFNLGELQELSHPPLSAPQLEQLHRATGGNPLFALTLLKRPHTAPLQTPPSLAELALEQVAPLSAHAQYALQIAAVLGAEFDYSLWEAVLARENLPTASLPTLAGEIERAGFLYPARAGYRFAHDLLRSALYTHLPSHTRQHLHAQTLATLTHQAPARTLDLLYHARQANARPQIARYALQMGEQTLASFNPAAAVDYFTQALENFAPEETGQRYRAGLGRVRAHEILGNRDAQRDDLTTLHTLADRLGDAHRRAETILAQARYHWQTGDYAQTLETASRGLALTDVPPETQAALLEILGQATRDQGDYPQARAWFERALALHQTIGNLSGEASVLDLLGIVAQRQGNLAEAIEKQTRSLALYRQVGDVYKQGHLLGNLGVVYWMSSDYAHARQMFAQAVEISQQLGELRAEIAHSGNLGALAGIFGDFETALARYAANLSRLEETGDRAMYANTLGNHAYTLFELGQFEEALASADRALAMNQELGRRRGEGFVQHTRGLALTELGRFAEAQAAFEASITLRETLGEQDTLSDTYGSLTLLYLQQGAFPQAEQAFAAARRTRTDQKNDEYRRNFNYVGYLLHHARGETSAALAHLLEAEDAMHAMARELPAPDQPRFLRAVSLNRQIQQALTAHAHRIAVRLVRAEVPLGKKLTGDDYVSVTWTLSQPGDDRHTPTTARRQHILRRLLSESAAQGAAPTDDDLAKALGVSRRTVLRDMEVLREVGVELKTRQRGSQ